MRYKTKPFEVEAIQFTGNNWSEVNDFCGYRAASYDPDQDIPNFARAGTYSMWEDRNIIAEVFDYLHQTWVGVRANDYIIKGSREEFYPCDPIVFESKYEPVYATGGVVKSGTSFQPDNGFIMPKSVTKDYGSEVLNVIEEGNWDCQLPAPKEIDE